MIQSHGLGEVLAKQSVAVLAGAALAAFVGRGEVAGAFQRVGHLGVITELPAVVVGNGLPGGCQGRQHVQHGLSRFLLGLALDGAGQDVPRLPLHRRDQRPAMPLADDGVGLPVAEAGAFLDDGGTLRDVRPVGDSAAIFGAALALAGPAAVAQAVVLATAVGPVLPDATVDGLAGHDGDAFQPHPSADLLRAPMLGQPIVDAFRHVGRHLDALGLGSPPLPRQLAGPLMAVASNIGIAPQFSTDSRWGAVQPLRHPTDGNPPRMLQLNVVSFLSDQVGVSAPHVQPPQFVVELRRIAPASTPSTPNWVLH